MNINYLVKLNKLGIYNLPKDVEFSNATNYKLLFVKPNKKITIEVHDNELCVLNLKGESLYINQDSPEDVLLVDSFNWFNQG